MDNKEKLYENYRTLHANALYGVPSKEAIRGQFYLWDSYYGEFLPDRSSRMLDAGAGHGAFILWLKERGFKNLEGVELSREEVECARLLGINEVAEADVRNFLKKSSVKYDCIFALDFIEHFEKNEIPEILKLMNSSLSRDGFIVIKTPNAEGIFGSRLRYADFTHETAFTESSLRQILSFTGFKMEKVKEAPPVIHGVLSLGRVFFWKLIRLIIGFLLIAETGTRSKVLTQNIIAVARKIS